MEELANQNTEIKVSGKKEKSDKITASKVWAWWHTGIDVYGTARKEAEKNCAYYDNEQWTREEKEKLEERGQPALVKNEIKPTVDLIIGTERKLRVDFTTVPRGQNDVQNASIAKEVLKYTGDVNYQKFLCSAVFARVVKAGWGFIEVCENLDPLKDNIRLLEVARGDLVWDPYAKEYDLEDAKYIIRGKWLELDDAIGLFPEHKEFLEMAVSDQEYEQIKETPYHGTEDQADRPGVLLWGDTSMSSVEWIDKSRKRVRLLECWYKMPTPTWFVENDLTGDVDEFDPSQTMDIIFTPGIKITKKTIRKVRFCIVAGSKVLEDNPSPYRDNCYPFVPFWAYRKEKDGSPYSVITQLRDMQDEINKRHSKAMHLLNAKQIIATSNAIDQKQNDWDTVMDESTRPDGKILLDPNAQNRVFEIVKPTIEIEQQYKYQQDAKDAIREISGVSGEMRGEETNASSGKAIIARGLQGQTMLGEIFDNYRRSCHLLEEKKWARIQQYYTKQKTFHITDKIGNYDFLEINKYIMDGDQILIQNDITKAKIDIVIDEQVYYATIRQALLEQMMSMVAKLPAEVALLMLDFVFEYSDLPKAAEMRERIKLMQNVLVSKMVAPPQLPGGNQGNVGNVLGMENVTVEGNTPVNSPQAIEAQMFGTG